MFRTISVVASTLLLGACTSVSHVPLSKEALGNLQGKQIASSKYERPDFTAVTPGKAAFAMVGVSAMISEGNAIVKDNEVEDPAAAISAGLQRRLSAAKGTTALVLPKTLEKDDIATIVASAPGSDYVLDMKTLNWSINYAASAWSRYVVIYVGRLRLIDVATQSVVAESACTSNHGEENKLPTKDELLENKAALLKSSLVAITNACVDVLAKDVLKL